MKSVANKGKLDRPPKKKTPVLGAIPDCRRNSFDADTTVTNTEDPQQADAATTVRRDSR